MEDIFKDLLDQDEIDENDEEEGADQAVSEATLQMTFDEQSQQAIRLFDFGDDALEHFRKLKPLKIYYESEVLEQPIVLLAWPVVNDEDIRIHVVPYLQNLN